MGKTYSTTAAAKRIGVSKVTLFAWMEKGLVGAPEPMMLGDKGIRFWTQAHIDAAKKFKGTLKAGRPTRKAKR